MMHKTRIILATIFGVCLLSGGAAAADVAIDGDVAIQNGNTNITVTADGSAGDAMAFTQSDTSDLVELNTTKGDIAFDGSNTISTSLSVGFDTSGLTELDSGSIILNNIETTDGQVRILPTHRKEFSVAASGIALEHRGPIEVDDGSSDFFVTAPNAGEKYTISVPTAKENQKVLSVDSFNSDYTQTNTTDNNGQFTATYTSDGGSLTTALRSTSAISFTDINPPDGGQTEETPPIVNTTVESKDFTYDGYTYDYEIVNEDTGDVVKTGTLSSNATISATLDNAVNGENNWSASVTTADGRSKETGILNFLTPDELIIRNESRPTQILDDDVRFTVRFIGDDENIIERETGDGRISLAGLERDRRYIVTIRSDDSDFVYRRIIVDELGDEANAYLLKKQASTSEVKFALDDPTGQFPPTQTRLYVEKPITRDFDSDGSNETQYAVVAGDVFGASGQFPLVVENSQRYRIRVESEEGGSSRVLGAYSTQSPERVPIQIEEIAPSGNVDGGRVVYGGVEGDQVAVRYLDPTQSTQSVEYRVVDDSGSEIVPNTTRNSQEFADFYDLPAGANASYTVDYTITREDGTKSSGSFDAGRIVGGVSERLDTNPDILELVSYVLIIASMGLVVLVNAQLAPLTGTGVATLLTVFGTVAIPAPILGIAGAISVLLPIGRR